MNEQKPKHYLQEELPRDVTGRVEVVTPAQEQLERLERLNSVRSQLDAAEEYWEAHGATPEEAVEIVDGVVAEGVGYVLEEDRDNTEEVSGALEVGVVEVSRDGEQRKTANTLTGASETNPEELEAVLHDAQEVGIDVDAVLSEMDGAAKSTKGSANRFFANIRNRMNRVAKPAQRSTESNEETQNNEEIEGRTAKDVIEDLKQHQIFLSNSESEGGLLSWTITQTALSLYNEAGYYASRPESDPQDVADLLDSVYNTARQEYCLKYSPTPSSDMELGMSRLMKEADESAAKPLFEVLGLVSANKIRQIKNLSTTKERFEYLLERASEYSRRPQVLRWHAINFQAKLAGYDSTVGYFNAGERGEVDTGDLTRIEAVEYMDPDLQEFEKQDAGFAFLRGLGVGDQLTVSIMAGMMGRISIPGFGDEEDVRIIDPVSLARELREISQRIDSIGVESATMLHEKCGITNFSDMSNDQLERMIRFVEKDPALIEELSSKEVCVLLRDATQDYNGAFQGVNEEYETNDGATLIFEVISMHNGGEEVASYCAQLEESGIHPSVLVIAGHGVPGVIRLGRGLLTARSEPPGSLDPPRVSLAESAIADLVGSMRPDRDGNCSIVFKSCMAAAEVPKDELIDEQDVMTSTLAQAAGVARERLPGSTVQIFGVKEESRLSRGLDGWFYDAYKGQPITRVVVTESGKEYVANYEEEFVLPMFQRE